jgi:hypothetical protein
MQHSICTTVQEVNPCIAGAGGLAAKSARARSVGEPPDRAWIRRQQVSTVPVWTLTAPDLSRALAMKRTAPILLGGIGTCLQTFARGILIGVDQLDYRDGLAVRISDLYNVREVSCEPVQTRIPCEIGYHVPI